MLSYIYISLYIDIYVCVSIVYVCMHIIYYICVYMCISLYTYMSIRLEGQEVCYNAGAMPLSQSRLYSSSSSLHPYLPTYIPLSIPPSTSIPHIPPPSFLPSIPSFILWCGRLSVLLKRSPLAINQRPILRFTNARSTEIASPANNPISIRERKRCKHWC